MESTSVQRRRSSKKGVLLHRADTGHEHGVVLVAPLLGFGLGPRAVARRTPARGRAPLPLALDDGFGARAAFPVGHLDFDLDLFPLGGVEGLGRALGRPLLPRRRKRKNTRFVVRWEMRQIRPARDDEKIF